MNSILLLVFRFALPELAVSRLSLLQVIRRARGSVSRERASTSGEDRLPFYSLSLNSAFRSRNVAVASTTQTNPPRISNQSQNAYRSAVLALCEPGPGMASRQGRAAMLPDARLRTRRALVAPAREEEEALRHQLAPRPPQQPGVVRSEGWVVLGAGHRVACPSPPAATLGVLGCESCSPTTSRSCSVYRSRSVWKKAGPRTPQIRIVELPIIQCPVLAIEQYTLSKTRTRKT